MIEKNDLQDISNKINEILELLTKGKKVLQLDGASSITGLSKSTLYKLTSSGEIPHYKRSKHLYFDRVELENWCKSNKSGGPEDAE